VSVAPIVQPPLLEEDPELVELPPLEPVLLPLVEPEVLPLVEPEVPPLVEPLLPPLLLPLLLPLVPLEPLLPPDPESGAPLSGGTVKVQ
jgi:hypothetical protein